MTNIMAKGAAKSAAMHAGAGVPQMPRSALRPAGPSFFAPACVPSQGGPGVYGSYVDEVLPYTIGQGAQKQTYYPHYNHLYRVAALTDAAGNDTERYRYVWMGFGFALQAFVFWLIYCEWQRLGGLKGYKAPGSIDEANGDPPPAAH
jgi:hypothetical protein